MINKLKAFSEWQALMVWLLLVLIVMSFFDYLFFTIDRARPDAGSESAGEEQQTKPNVPAPAAALIDIGGLRFVSSQGSTLFQIMNGQTEMGEIREDKPSQVGLFKRIGNHVYLGVKDEAAGNPPSFTGPKQIYRLDLEDSTLSEVFSCDCLVSDISADETSIIEAESFLVGDEVNLYINIHRLAGGEDLSFAVPKAYRAAGNAFFTSDGRRIFYDVTKDDGHQAKFDTLVIDLSTGEQQVVASDGGAGQAAEWAKES